MKTSKSINSEDLDSQGSQREPAAMFRGLEMTDKDTMTTFINGPVTFYGPVTYICDGREAKKLLERELEWQTYNHLQAKPEELCHFVHPEIEDEEAWRIHKSIKRLVAHQKVPEICTYLKELKQKGKVMLPSNSNVMYNELVRLGMPTDEGYSEKYFTNCYLK